MKLFFIFILIASCSSNVVHEENKGNGRFVASTPGIGRNCYSFIKSLLKIKRASFVDELRYGTNPKAGFRSHENFKKLFNFVNTKRMEENFYFGKEIFYSIDEGGFSLSDKVGRSFSGAAFIKNGVLYLEIGGAISSNYDKRFVVDILNSLILASLMAKENFSHLKSVKIIGKQLVNEKLATLLHKFGFIPFVKKEGYGKVSFEEYIETILRESEDEQIVNDLGESVIRNNISDHFANDFYLDLDFK